MTRSDADRTVAAAARALADDHPDEIRRIIAIIAARAVIAEQRQPTADEMEV